MKSAIKIEQVAASTYYNIMGDAAVVYSSAKFIATVESRADEIRYYIVTTESGSKIGIVIGLRNGVWQMPFSAPFDYPIIKGKITAEEIKHCFVELRHRLNSPIEITLPSDCYKLPHQPLLRNALREIATDTWDDRNYSYTMPSALENWRENLSASARNHFNRACREGFELEETRDVERMYAVIKANRDARGYPLAMTLQQIARTIEEAVDARMHILSRCGEDVAATLLYEVIPSALQLIYWGDSPGYSRERPMNILPQLMMQSLSEATDGRYRLIDIGPASTRGIHNEGLCTYKQSIGCDLSLKPTFII